MPVRRYPDGTIAFINKDNQETGRWAGKRLTPYEIFGYVSKWFPQEEWVTAIAVCLAESSGYTESLGDLLLVDAVYGPSVGLFQVRSFKNPGASGRDRTLLLDPDVNVKFAYELWKNKGWKPWGAYTSESYLKTLSKANIAVGDHYNMIALGYYKLGGR